MASTIECEPISRPYKRFVRGYGSICKPLTSLVFFDSGSNRSFVSTTFALHVDRKLTPLTNKLIVTTPLGE